MNIMDIFRGFGNPNQGQNPTPPQNNPGGLAPMPGPSGSQTPGQPLPGTLQTPQTPANGVIPASGGTAPTPSVPTVPDAQSQLAAFEKVWQTVAANPAASPDQLFANLDPAKIAESASKIDFARVVTPELLTKISGGGQDAVAALQQALNLVTQNSYTQNTMTTAKMLEQTYKKAQENFLAQLPNLVKQQAVAERLNAANPLMNNPAIKPLVGALQQQLITQYPQASAADIEKRVTDYFGALGSVIQPVNTPANVPGNQGGQKAEVYDFTSFLNGN